MPKAYNKLQGANILVACRITYHQEKALKQLAKVHKMTLSHYLREVIQSDLNVKFQDDKVLKKLNKGKKVDYEKVFESHTPEL